MRSLEPGKEDWYIFGEAVVAINAKRISVEKGGSRIVFGCQNRHGIVGRGLQAVRKTTAISRFHCGPRIRCLHRHSVMYSSSSFRDISEGETFSTHRIICSLFRGDVRPCHNLGAVESDLVYEGNS